MCVVHATDSYPNENNRHQPKLTTTSPNPTTIQQILGVAGAFIGAALAMVAATLVESAVCTAFVLFAEDPQSLEISHSDLSDGLVQVFGVVGGDGWME